MSTRRSQVRTLSSFASLAIVCAAVIAACGQPVVPTIEFTSHVDGERVFGSRTVSVAGTATNAAQVQVLLDGSVVATVTVAANAFAADVTLGDNRNQLRAQTPDGLGSDQIELVYPWVDATTFRPMDIAIGQPDKVSNTPGTGPSLIGSQTYGAPLYVGGILYVPDSSNHRILGFLDLPTADGASADFVLGQGDFAANAPNDDNQDGVEDATPSARTLNCPSALASDGTRLLVADACNARVLVYDTLPTTTFAPADVVIGQASMTETKHTSCSLDAPFSYTERLALGGGKLVVPDGFGHRVLVWNAIPTANGTPPDLVLGQPASSATCVHNDDDQDGFSDDPSARTFFRPWDAWTDGDRLLVTDYYNFRVLLWRSFPTSDFAPADIVIGQATMTTRAPGAGATGFDFAYTVASNGNQILIPDYEQHRVLVFNAFPTANGAAADAVLGQGDFLGTTWNDDDQDGLPDATPSARTVGRSYGAWMGEGIMIINDMGNSRYALFVD